MTRKYELEFDKYTEVDFVKDYYKEKSGIYFVYFGKVSEDKSYFYQEKLFYIGKTENSTERFYNHEKVNEWKQKAKGKDIYVKFAVAEEKELLRIEAALIYEIQPDGNEMCKKSFNYDSTEVEIKGIQGMNTIKAEKTE